MFIIGQDGSIFNTDGIIKIYNGNGKGNEELICAKYGSGTVEVLGRYPEWYTMSIVYDELRDAMLEGDECYGMPEAWFDEVSYMCSFRYPGGSYKKERART